MLIILGMLVLGGYLHHWWRAEAALNTLWEPDAGAQLFAQRALPEPIEENSISTSPRSTGTAPATSSSSPALDVQHRSVIAQTIPPPRLQ
ncbi:hypothetical protein G7054_g14667 [Neopestalotiopsis clavispora]|nr:hypothetical protein G7054_g14667 [Neopestalotiopsis clavispora]